METFQSLVSAWLDQRDVRIRTAMGQAAEAAVRHRLDKLAVVYDFEDLDSKAIGDIGSLLKDD